LQFILLYAYRNIMALRKDEENEEDRCCSFESGGSACSKRNIKNPVILSKSMLK